MRGADAATVRRALEARDPLPGTRGFAGAVDGALVRDALGRVPLYVEREAGESGAFAPGDWSHDPAELAAPLAVPAGHYVTEAGAERVWTLPDPEPVDDEAAVRQVRSAVDAALERVDGDAAVAFSGGVDSALVAARVDGLLYVAGFPDSHDVAAARESAAAMDREVRVIEVTHDDIERAVPEVVAATGRTNAMDVQIALPLFLTAERVAADGHDRLLVGQGADELFGGYAKVAKAPEDPRVEADTVRGARREVLGSLPEQLPRDVLALRAAGVDPVAPLLDDRVVAAALALSGDQLVRGAVRKWALREGARASLPAAVAEREKKAVQYGSLVARELDRLARQDGFKRRMDDHVTKYVRAQAERAGVDVPSVGSLEGR